MCVYPIAAVRLLRMIFLQLKEDATLANHEQDVDATKSTPQIPIHDQITIIHLHKVDVPPEQSEVDEGVVPSQEYQVVLQGVQHR